MHTNLLATRWLRKDADNHLHKVNSLQQHRPRDDCLLAAMWGNLVVCHVLRIEVHVRQRTDDFFALIGAEFVSDGLYLVNCRIGIMGWKILAKNVPSEGVSFKNFAYLCHIIDDFASLFCSTKGSDISDMTQPWARLCSFVTYNRCLTKVLLIKVMVKNALLTLSLLLAAIVAQDLHSGILYVPFP